jgi:hypothetical protein
MELKEQHQIKETNLGQSIAVFPSTNKIKISCYKGINTPD